MWVLNLGRHGWGVRIPLSSAFQGDESTIAKRHQIKQEYEMIKQQKTLLEYIKNHYRNALLFATSKLRKGNQQENRQNNYSRRDIYDTPETAALATFIYIELFGEVNSLSMEQLLEFNKRIK
jgi:hypothetical protein